MINKITIEVPQINLVVGAEFTSPHPMQDEEAVKNILKSKASFRLIEELELLGGYIHYD
jgi:hypothetical protein